MTRLSLLSAALRRSLDQRSTLKVIAGLMNFDAASVARVSRAAGLGGADLIDVACDPELVALALEVSGGAGHPGHGGRIEVHQASDHLERGPLVQAAAKSGRQQ